MTMTATFKESVSNKDFDMIHIIMKNSMILDKSFKDFNEMDLYTKKNNLDIYDSHDDYEFITDKSKWTEFYMNKIITRVLRNFSHERIDHLKEVIPYVYQNVINTSSSEQIEASNKHTNEQQGTTLSYQEQKAKDQHEGNYRTLKIATGAVIGAGIGAGIGAAVGSSIVVSGLVGAIVVGGATLVVTNK